MSTLKAHEKVILERIFDRGGYVLDFNESKYAAFFREHNIDINADKYQFNGTSKMKRLRAFLEIETDAIVSQILAALLDYANAVEEISQTDNEKAKTTINRLSGKPISNDSKLSSTEDFLKQEFVDVDLARLHIDDQLRLVIEQRLQEIHCSLKAGTSLATIFLCGSTLEGILLDAATKQPEQFNSAKSAPRDKEGKVKQLYEWTLDNLITVAHEVGLLSLDVKKYGHTLKDFRNYIHPRQQAIQGFRPDHHTAKISWHVLQAAIADLNGLRKK